MRVIAGEAISLPLKAPVGMETRPTTDRIKETLFNMIQDRIGDSVFIDIFSGSGAIGIEAISRGAKKAYFIESDKKALGCIRDNLNFTRFSNCAEVLGQDANSAIYSIRERADIVFMDPPYKSGIENHILSILYELDFVDSDTLIIIEASLEKDSRVYEECGFSIWKEKKYKSNKHVFLYKKIEQC